MSGACSLWQAWNCENGAVMDSVRASRKPMPDEPPEVALCLTTSRDGALVAVGTDEGAVLVWRIKTGRHGRGPKQLRPLHDAFQSGRT